MSPGFFRLIDGSYLNAQMVRDIWIFEPQKEGDPFKIIATLIEVDEEGHTTSSA